MILHLNRKKILECNLKIKKGKTHLQRLIQKAYHLPLPLMKLKSQIKNLLSLGTLLKIKNNMADGKISPSFVEEFMVIDGKDNEHRVFMAFRRTDFNKYAVEVYLPGQEVDPASGTNMIKSGEITFDKDGKGSAPTGLDNLTIDFDVKGEKFNSTFNLNWKKINMYGSIFDGDITTNGKKEGTLMNTSIDKKGNLTGHYTN